MLSICCKVSDAYAILVEVGFLCYKKVAEIAIKLGTIALRNMLYMPIFYEI